jgi:hypothetical protein
MWEYFENLYFNKMEILGEIDKGLDVYDVPKLNQEDINHLNRFITSNKLEVVMNNLPKNKRPGLSGFTDKFYYLSIYCVMILIL